MTSLDCFMGVIIEKESGTAGQQEKEYISEKDLVVRDPVKSWDMESLHSPFSLSLSNFIQDWFL